MGKYTEAARDQECTLQIHPYCLGTTDTTCLNHLNSEDKGMGNKSPDWWGVDGCHNCHAIIDGRMPAKDVSPMEIEACKWRGLYRTWRRRMAMGLIVIKGVK